MALTYQQYSGNKKIEDTVQIARNGETPIYYTDEEIDILREIELENAMDMVGDLVDEAAEDLQIHNVGTNKLNDLDMDIYSKTCPKGRKEKRIYNEVKNKLAARESKLYYPRGAKIQVVPMRVKNQRNAAYVSGQSGSGKSWWAAHYAKEYQRDNPGNAVYLLSRKPVDPSFDDNVEGLIRIKLDRHFINGIKRSVADEYSENTDPLERFSDSLIIFDDFEQIMDPAIKKAVLEFKNSVFQLGRQHNIDIVSIQHKSLGGQKSITDIGESNMLVCFPRKNLGETRKLLVHYCCYQKEELERILDEETRKERWMCIIRPNILITEKYIKVLD